MSPEELVHTLTPLGVPHEVRQSGADGALLVLPDYGRVLGLWPHLRAENALWVNPEFVASLQVGVKDDAWSNPGGDWVWLAPAEEFLPDGVVSPAVDPGRFTLSADRGTLCLSNRGEVLARRSETAVRFRLTRRLRPLFEPDIDEVCGPTWLRRAGWEEEMDLQVEGRCPVAVQLWSITQAPPGSEVRTGSRSVACVEEGDSDRARLLVKTADAGSATAGPPVIPAGRSAPVELRFLSPPPGPSARGRLRWKTTTLAFSGRSPEIRQIAERMVYSE